jgi:hypothetical protein
LAQSRSGRIGKHRIDLTQGRGGFPITVLVYSYTIYHSPNAYLGGAALLRRALVDLPGTRLIRRPIYIRVSGACWSPSCSAARKTATPALLFAKIAGAGRNAIRSRSSI